jgi:hypothetical protein
VEIRKKALITLKHVYQLDEDLIPNVDEELRSTISDRDPIVVSAAVQFFLIVIKVGLLYKQLLLKIETLILTKRMDHNAVSRWYFLFNIILILFRISLNVPTNNSSEDFTFCDVNAHSRTNPNNIFLKKKFLFIGFSLKNTIEIISTMVFLMSKFPYVVKIDGIILSIEKSSKISRLFESISPSFNASYGRQAVRI